MHLITDLDTGGAEMALYRLVSAMDRSRFSTVVVSMLGPGPIGRRIEKEGIQVCYLDMRRGIPNPAGLWRLRKIIRRERSHIIQTWMYHANLLGLLVGWLCGVPAIIWNVRCSNMDMNQYRKLSSLVIKLSARLSFMPEAVIVNSEAGRSFHESIGYRPKTWKIIPNGFDLDCFHAAPQARENLKKELRLAEDAVIIGMVARFDPMKDHKNFLKAASGLLRRHDNAHFVLAGLNMDNNNADLMGWISDLGIGDNVHLLGERSDIANITAGFDIATSSSYGEGFPNVVGEAMSCCVPCAVTDVGDSSLVVGDTGRVVPPKDPTAIESAWRDLIEMGEAGRSLLGVKARLRIEEKYSLPAIVSQYETLYSEFAS